MRLQASKDPQVACGPLPTYFVLLLSFSFRWWVGSELLLTRRLVAAVASVERGTIGC